MDTVFVADSTKPLLSLPDESIHLILSDIPYGIGAEDWDVLHPNTNSAYLGSSPAQEEAGAVFKKRGKPINGWTDADRAIPRQYQEWCASWASEWLRVLKPGASAVVFAGRRFPPMHLRNGRCRIFFQGHAGLASRPSATSRAAFKRSIRAPGRQAVCRGMARLALGQPASEFRASALVYEAVQNGALSLITP